eukprot:2926319-Pyramimonas_sp.AAC.1
MHVSWRHEGGLPKAQWLLSQAATTTMSAHSSHVSWPQRELRRRPQWLRLHAFTASHSAPITRAVSP